MGIDHSGGTFNAEFKNNFHFARFPRVETNKITQFFERSQINIDVVD